MNLPHFDIPNYNKYFGEKHNVNVWSNFFKFIRHDHKILDFGCGAGWSIHTGRKLGYDILGLETTAIARFNKFDTFRKALGIDKYVELYKGLGNLPFPDNSFTMIVCRASFNKFHNSSRVNDEKKLAVERLNEFSRLLYGPRIVIITGKYFREEFKQFDFKVYNWGKRGIRQLWNGDGLQKILRGKVNI